MPNFSAKTPLSYVGYQNVQPEYSYHMLGMPFTDCSGEEIMIGDIKGEFEMFDNIQRSFVDDEGYVDFVVYEYYPEEQQGKGSKAGWYLDGVISDDTIGNGHAVWFIKDSGEAPENPLTVAGAVDGAAAREYEGFPEQYNMICSAFPCGFNPNGENVEWANLEDGDNIQVAFVDDEGYVDFVVYEWYNEEMQGKGSLAGWYLDGVMTDEDVVGPGQGFWLVLENYEEAYMKETSPLAQVD